MKEMVSTRIFAKHTAGDSHIELRVGFIIIEDKLTDLWEIVCKDNVESGNPLLTAESL
jgi:hypothetical protein